MSARAQVGTALAGVAWIVLGAVLVSFSRSPNAGDACHPHALWTGSWFFVAPLVALVGLAITIRSPRRATGLTANALLLLVWGLAARCGSSLRSRTARPAAAARADLSRRLEAASSVEESYAAFASRGKENVRHVRTPSTGPTTG